MAAGRRLPLNLVYWPRPTHRPLSCNPSWTGVRLQSVRCSRASRCERAGKWRSIDIDSSFSANYCTQVACFLPHN